MITTSIAADKYRYYHGTFLTAVSATTLMLAQILGWLLISTIQGALVSTGIRSECQNWYVFATKFSNLGVIGFPFPVWPFRGHDHRLDREHLSLASQAWIYPTVLGLVLTSSISDSNLFSSSRTIVCRKSSSRASSGFGSGLGSEYVSAERLDHNLVVPCG